MGGGLKESGGLTEMGGLIELLRYLAIFLPLLINERNYCKNAAIPASHIFFPVCNYFQYLDNNIMINFLFTVGIEIIVS